MSVITVQTGMNMNPWKIPQRAQQVIMNEHLNKNNIFPDIIFSAGIFSEHFSRPENFRKIARTFICGTRIILFFQKSYSLIMWKV